jgi:Holliday junction resolvase
LAKQKESLFTVKVRKYLNELGVFHFRAHGFLAGLPDIIGCYQGRFIALEIKASEKAPRSKLQQHIIQKIRLAGGQAFFVYPENFERIKYNLEYGCE